MSAFVRPPGAADGSWTSVDKEGDPYAAPGAVVTRDADGMITDVDLDAADRYQAQKGFPAGSSTEYAEGYAD